MTILIGLALFSFLICPLNLVFSQYTCSIPSESTYVGQALIKSLLDGSDVSVRPMSDCGPLRVTITPELWGIVRDPTRPQIYQLQGIFGAKWTDSRLTWDPSQYSGIAAVRIPGDKVWIPDLTIFNSVNFNQKFTGNTVYPLSLTSAGLVVSVAPSSAEVECNTTQDAAGHDLVSCNQQVGLWLYDMTHAIVKVPDLNITTQNFDEWNTSLYTLVSAVATYQVKFYPGYEELYNMINFRTVVRSKSEVPQPAAPLQLIDTDRFSMILSSRY